MAAHADENGSSFWTPGEYAAGAALPASPGWTLQPGVYTSSGHLNAPRGYPSGDAVYFGIRQAVLNLDIQASWAPRGKLLGAQPMLAVSFGVGRTTNRIRLVVEPGDTQTNVTSTASGALDVIPLASLVWTRGNANWMAYLTGNVPTGTVLTKRLSNVSLGHGAVDFGGGYTWQDTASGWEASAVAGLTVNMINPRTDYRNGLDAHLDWSVSRADTSGWQLGLAGYVYWQLTADSGSGAVRGPFESRTVGLGPQFVSNFTVRGRPWQANVRAYGDVWAQNRPQGFSVFAAVSLPLGRAPR